MIRQIAHVCFGTPNLEAVLRFYVDLLGLEVAHEFRNAAGERYGAFLYCGSRTFLEIFNDKTAEIQGDFYRHLCFEVDDLDATITALNAAGIVSESRRGRTDQVLLATAKDPDGREIEFQQYDSQSMQHRFLHRVQSHI